MKLQKFEKLLKSCRKWSHIQESFVVIIKGLEVLVEKTSRKHSGH